jgi:hypothetical protein
MVGLGMKVPPNTFTVKDVERFVGKDSAGAQASLEGTGTHLNTKLGFPPLIKGNGGKPI